MWRRAVASSSVAAAVVSACTRASVLPGAGRWPVAATGRASTFVALVLCVSTSHAGSGSKVRLCSHSLCDRDDQAGAAGDDENGDDIKARLLRLWAALALPLETPSSADAATAKVWLLVKNGVPAKLGYGFVMGFSSGFCLKKASKAMALVVGCCFLGLQTLASLGYIQVDHHKLKHDLERLLDLDDDGDVDEDDARSGLERVMHVLEVNLPTGGGFMAGLLLGLRA